MLRTDILTLLALAYQMYVSHGGRNPISRFSAKQNHDLNPSASPTVVTNVLVLGLVEMYADLVAHERMIEGTTAGPVLSYTRSNSNESVDIVAITDHFRARDIRKRIFDFGIAAASIFLLGPVWLTLAVAVRMSTPGPALFKQIRVGRNGRLFKMYKFRTMYIDSEARLARMRDDDSHGEGILFKMREDPRVTRVGRFLRRYSLDELPQLINVLAGDMSLVGPRPPLALEFARYDAYVKRRMLVKPGLTGLWQISGRSDLSWEESVLLDLEYVARHSLRRDLKILFMSVLAVTRGAGAY